MSAVLGSNVTGKYAIQHLEIATVDLMPSKWQQKQAGRHKFADRQICLYRQSTTCICSTAPQKSPVHMHAVCVCVQRLFASVCKDVACFASPGSNQDVCFSNCRETTLTHGTDGEAGVEDRASLVMVTQRKRYKTRNMEVRHCQTVITQWELGGEYGAHRSLVEYKA